MAEKLTHWRSFFDNKHLGVFSLPNGNEITVTISSIQQSEERYVNEDGEEVIPVDLYFKECDLPMWLSIKNGDTIEQMYGMHIENWIGKQITLFAGDAVMRDGTIKKGLRVKNIVPQGMIKPTLVPNTIQMQSAVAIIKSGGSIKDIELKYNISDDARLELEILIEDQCRK